MPERNVSFNLNNPFFLYIMAFFIVSNLNRVFTSINSTFQISSFAMFMNILLILIFYKTNLNKQKLYIGMLLMAVHTMIFINFGLVNSKLDSSSQYIVMKYIQNFVICVVVVFVINRKIHLQQLLLVIGYAGVLLAVLGILEFLEIFKVMEMVGVYKENNGRPGSMWIDPNQYAAAIVFSYLCISKYGNNKVNILLKIIMILGIVASSSRSAFFVLLIIIFIESIVLQKWELRVIKKIIVGCSITMIFLALLFTFIRSNLWIQDLLYNSRLDRLMFWNTNEHQDDVSNGRMDALVISVETASRNLIFGLGIGNSTKVTGQGAHNMFIYTFAETGIISLFTYILFLLSLLITAIKNFIVNGNKFSISLFMYLFLYSFFSHTLMINGISGIAVGIILLYKKFMYVNN
ncbi:O-antigen ligase family protein [Chengkuizengella sp. SCS-71B]|uniref:O-antigen ligase family protein n=1 Tax=Chengkuizengella sp. SCS-71B TaxID=3115290 RepID=UPI0032C20D5E